MLENIFVAVMCVFALGIGIWTWWYENYKPADGVVCFRRLINHSISKSPKAFLQHTYRRKETIAWIQE